MKKISLETIAKQLNVSIVTVHKALKNQHGVGPELRKKIIDLAAELGYATPTPELNFIHIIQKDFLISMDEQYYMTIYYHLNRACTLAGAKLYFVAHDMLSATTATLRNLMQEKSITGIFLSGQMDRELLSEIEKLKKPVVCIDFYSSDYNFNYIYIDNYYAGYTLAKYLIKQGHRRIGFVGNIKFSNAIADRYFGYLRALNRFNIEWSYHINENIERTYTTINFDSENLPTAFICHCDRAASILYSQLQKIGIRIPEDISVISFDNTDICEILTPKLTSFGIDKEIFAKQAFQLMKQAIQKKANSLNYIKLNLSLYERESVRRLGAEPTKKLSPQNILSTNEKNIK